MDKTKPKKYSQDQLTKVAVFAKAYGVPCDELSMRSEDRDAKKVAEIVKDVNKMLKLKGKKPI